uniref:Major sperm protein n=1 Tax=Brugia malayi TaxID=6279 RepID=A0A0H5RZH5_BRUMA|nr:Bm7685 [Brugia malayi]
MTESSAFSTTSSMLPGGIPRPIDHTPDENEFQMTLIPMTRIIFMCDTFNKDEDIGIKPVTTSVTIHNDTVLVQAFKVKCTSNKMFTIRPSYGIIAPNEKKNTCNMQPREIFEKYKPEGVKRILCQFKNASGQPIHQPDPKPNTEIA